MKTKQAFALFAITVLFASMTATTMCAANQARPTDSAILESYEKIQLSLASDSLKGVTENAEAISKAVKDDPDKRTDADLKQHADKLANDKDLKTAREDFKNLSAGLIAYLEKSNFAKVGYEQNYCPMVNASWLQKGKKVNNPYFGKEMPGCGTPKKSF